MPEIFLDNDEFDSDEKEIDLRGYFRIINKRKGTIITFFLLTFIIVIIATFTATPLYKATTKVMLEKNTSDSLTSNYSYAPYDPKFLETQRQLIQSAAVVEKVVQTLNPDRIYNSFFYKEERKASYINDFLSWLNDIYLSIRKSLGIDTLLPSSTGSDVTKGISSEKPIPLTKAQKLEQVIKKGISVEPVHNSRIVKIGFISDNPVLSMKVANSVAKAYIEELADMQMEMSRYSIEWMTKKATALRKKLEESEQALFNYKKKHEIVTVENRLTVLPQRIAELSQSLTKAETKREELFAVYNQVKHISKDKLETIPAIVANTSVDSINKKILLSEQKIAELSKKYGYKHPKMITAMHELKGLKKQKEKILQDAVQTIKNQYQLAVANENSIRDLLSKTKFQAETLEEKSIQLGMLKRKVDINKYLYEALIKKIKEKGITEKTQTVNVLVIEKAQLPRFPAKPRKALNILLGCILGLFGGIGCAFFLEYFDNTIKTPEDVEDKLNIPVISIIDLFKDKDQTVVEHVLQNPSSPIAESFKGLRTSVLLSSAKNPPKLLLITSMAPKEGKSSIAACLATSIAQTGKKILLIDADMRRPSQHKIFNIDNTVGLSSMLAGLSENNESINLNVFNNLDVLTSGPIPPNPSELLSSTTMKNMLTYFSVSYDMIIIDSPPLVSVTDPLVLSQDVDGVIIVTWAGKTTNEILEKGIKQLKKVNAPITGVVLNRFNAKKSGYYYYDYGEYYYSSEF